MIHQPIAPILHLIDLAHDIDLALALRAAGRPRRRAARLKGWATRRDRDAALRKAVGFEAEGQQPGPLAASPKPLGKTPTSLFNEAAA